MTTEQLTNEADVGCDAARRRPRPNATQEQQRRPRRRRPSPKSWRRSLHQNASLRGKLSLYSKTRPRQPGPRRPSRRHDESERRMNELRRPRTTIEGRRVQKDRACCALSKSAHAQNATNSNRRKGAGATPEGAGRAEGAAEEAETGGGGRVRGRIEGAATARDSTSLRGGKLKTLKNL